MHNATADNAFEVEDARAVEFEAVLDNSGTTTLPPQPKAPRGGTTPTQDGGSRPTRVWKPVSRLVLSFKGKKILLEQCMNALYGSMVASLMFYKKLVKALKSYGFEYNP